MTDDAVAEAIGSVVAPADWALAHPALTVHSHDGQLFWIARLIRGTARDYVMGVGATPRAALEAAVAVAEKKARG